MFNSLPSFIRDGFNNCANGINFAMASSAGSHIKQSIRNSINSFLPAGLSHIASLGVHFIPETFIGSMVTGQVIRSIRKSSNQGYRNQPLYNLVAHIRQLERKEIGTKDFRDIQTRTSQLTNDPNRTVLSQFLNSETLEKVSPALLGRLKAASVTKGNQTIYTARIIRNPKKKDIIISVALDKNEKLNATHLGNASVFIKSHDKNDKVLRLVNKITQNQDVIALKNNHLKNILDPELVKNIKKNHDETYKTDAIITNEGLRDLSQEALDHFNSDSFKKHNNRDFVTLTDNKLNEFVQTEKIRRGVPLSTKQSDAVSPELIQKLFEKNKDQITMLSINHGKAILLKDNDNPLKSDYIISHNNVYKVTKPCDQKDQTDQKPRALSNFFNNFFVKPLANAVKNVSDALYPKDFTVQSFPLDIKTGNTVNTKAIQPQNTAQGLNVIDGLEGFQGQTKIFPVIEFASKNKMDIFDIAHHISRQENQEELYMKKYEKESITSMDMKKQSDIPQNRAYNLTHDGA